MSQARLSLNFSPSSPAKSSSRPILEARTPGQECSPVEDNADLSHQRYSRVDERDFTDHRRAVYVGLHMSMGSLDGADGSSTSRHHHHHRRTSHGSHRAHHSRHKHHDHHHHHHHHHDGGGGHHRHHHRGHHHAHSSNSNSNHHHSRHPKLKSDSMAPLTSSFSLDNGDSPVPGPGERVRTLLSHAPDDAGHEAHELFTELEELKTGEGGVLEWKERARWVKYEEDVEWGGDKWSKPHVAALSLHSLFELRSCILQGTVLLNMEADNLTTVADLVLDDLIATGQLEEGKRHLLRAALLCRHSHQNETKKQRLRRGTSEEVQPLSHDLTNNETIAPDHSQLRQNSLMGNSPAGARRHVDSHFMKKLPANVEASNVLVGQVDFLQGPLIAFVRLANSFIADLTEVPIPTRFLFILLGPKGEEERYHEIGRSISTLMADPVFHNVAYKASNRGDLLAGVDEFLDQVVVLPPGEWDPTIRLPPPSSPRKASERLMANASAPCPSREKPNHGGGHGGGDGGEGNDEDPGKDLHHAGLKRTKRLFGGLIDDIKRRWPYYFWSDFKDALHPQVIPAIIFIYFACIAPTITFGGLLEDSTDGYMGTMEMIFASCICGMAYSLVSGQPLTILGATGPMLVFEGIVYSFSVDQGIPFLPFRFWIGMWTALYLLLMVAFDASALIGLFTRFTEETFSALISFIFIYEAFFKISKLEKSYPPLGDFYVNATLEGNCSCLAGQEIIGLLPSDLNLSTCTGPAYNGTTVGPGCPPEGAQGDIFFLSFIEFFGTFLIAFFLKKFRGTRFFPTRLRIIISDFAVIIAIASMLVMDIVYQVNTPKLFVPLKFQPTREDRGWLVQPLGDGVKAWLPFAACIPAILAVILVFMDQQITALLVNRREHKLKKGPGYHLDLLVVGVLIALCSLLGLPWLVAATVRSVTHVSSLNIVDTNTAPGEKPKFLGVREQRLTNFCVFALHGISILAAPALRHVPLPILYGLFLYMGVASLRGVQFIERIALLLQPSKNHYDVYYVRHVPVIRMHLFTAIQIFSLAVLCIVKLTPAKLIFPIAVLGLVLVRHFMKYLFTEQELEILDDKMPELLKRKKQDATHRKDEMVNHQRELDIEEAMASTPTCPLDRWDGHDGIRHRHSNGSLRNQPTSLQQGARFNLTDELDRCDLWQHTHTNTRKKAEDSPPPAYSQSSNMPEPMVRESAL